MTQRDDMRRVVGGGFRVGNWCTPVVDSCQCMAKPIQYCKVKIKIKKLKRKQTNFFFLYFIFYLLLFFNFRILYWFCHTLTWICHGCTWVLNPEPPSHHPPHIISLGHPSAPAPSIPYPALNLDWRFASCMVVYMSQCWINISPSAHFYSHMVTYYNRGTEAENKVRSFLWSRCLVQVSTT